MLFSEVIGQQEIKAKLRNLVEHNRLSHALLLNAPEGAGGLPLALAFAQFLVCDRVSANDSANEFPAESCNECPSCVKAAKTDSSGYSLFLSGCYPTKQVTTNQSVRLYYRNGANSFRSFLTEPSLTGSSLFRQKINREIFQPMNAMRSTANSA